ncbi:hypothetical protein [Mesobacillus harenae]|uniref:hypothetical protein n=1 Tax=Mesobacillus harenae TaxID=2213203 RepID=UPI0015805119|nr:hypothetical protein [Mesobacillus harenae]
MEWINKIINIFWELSNVLLIGILLVLVTFLMSLIFKKKMTLLAAMMVIILGSTFILDRLQYTTFQKLVSEELNEESTVRSITIRKNGLVENNQKTSRVTIVDEETLQQILDDFSEVKLKRDRDARQLLKEYSYY